MSFFAEVCLSASRDVITLWAADEAALRIPVSTLSVVTFITRDILTPCPGSRGVTGFVGIHRVARAGGHHRSMAQGRRDEREEKGSTQEHHSFCCTTRDTTDCQIV